MTRIDPAELARLVETLGTLAPEPDVPGDVSVALRDASAAITALVADLAQVTAARDQHFSQALENGRQALDAEARLREIERAWEMFDGLAVQDVGEQQKSYEALRAAITLAKP